MPKNYQDRYLGQTTLEFTRTESLNKAAARMAQTIGLDRMLNVGPDSDSAIYGSDLRALSVVGPRRCRGLPDATRAILGQPREPPPYAVRPWLRPGPEQMGHLIRLPACGSFLAVSFALASSMSGSLSSDSRAKGIRGSDPAKRGVNCLKAY
jgi:hypothetical protein